jgi:hypothetical protein
MQHGQSISLQIYKSSAWPSDADHLARWSELEPCSERATRGYPALFCELDPSKRSKPVQLSLFREAATSGCPSGEGRTPRSWDRGVFHFGRGEAAKWSVGDGSAFVSRCPWCELARRDQARRKAKSRCLSLLVSPPDLSLVNYDSPRIAPRMGSTVPFRQSCGRTKRPGY